MEFNNIDDLYDYIKEDVTQSLEDDVGKVVSDILYEEIMNSYLEYEPWGLMPYERRYDSYGGWGDYNMINVEVVKETNFTSGISITNNALGVGDDYGDFLAPLIEQGIYEWTHGEDEEDYSYSNKPVYLNADKLDVPPKRPVFKRTKKRLEDGKIIRETLKESLKNKGYEIK